MKKTFTDFKQWFVMWVSFLAFVVIEVGLVYGFLKFFNAI